MKNLENLNDNLFKNFENDRLENLAACVGGAEGNTRGGFDWRDKCSKRKCDPATTVCKDAPAAPSDPNPGLSPISM